MKKVTFLFTLMFFLIPFVVRAQSDSLTVRDAVENQAVINDSDSVTPASLLPKHMIPTQRLLWGEHGLMRKSSRFSLTEEHRDFELELRSKMLTAHRYLGYATMLGMLAEGFVGQKLYSGDQSLKGLHEGIAGAVNVCYFSTASLALFAPPAAKDRKAGFNALTVHKYLSVVHLTSMIATNVLAGMIESNPGLKPWHRAAAYTAFGSFFTSMVVIHF